MTAWNRTSLVGIGAGIAVGALVMLAGSDGSSKLGAIPVFALCGMLSYLINWAVFVPSNIAQTEHYFDLTGSITYLTITAVAVLLSDDLDARALIVAGLVWVDRRCLQ